MSVLYIVAQSFLVVKHDWFHLKNCSMQYQSLINLCWDVFMTPFFCLFYLNDIHYYWCLQHKIEEALKNYRIKMMFLGICAIVGDKLAHSWCCNNSCFLLGWHFFLKKFTEWYWKLQNLLCLPPIFWKFMCIYLSSLD